jgi:mono/diheme cytochrome c family protein
VKVPVTLKIGALTIATTAFYTLVGQLVPQKEVLPPKETVLAKEMTPDDLVKAGQEIMNGKGICFTCHTLGKSGALRYPDLQGIGARAGSRRPGLSDVDYLAQSIYDPGAFIVPGFNPGMPVINKPPIGLTDQEIVAVIAYLQSLGGKVTVSLNTKVWPLDEAHKASAGGSAPGAGAAASPSPSPGAAAAPEVGVAAAKPRS